jgi:hypothetical protein
MRPLGIVRPDPIVEVGLQLSDAAIQALPEGHAVELVQERAMEALADAVGLRAPGLGAGMIDILDCEV